MKKVLILFALLVLSFYAIAKKNMNFDSEKFRYRNSIQLEAFGSAAIYSFNYERNLINLATFKTSVQLGAAYLPPSTGLINFHFPLILNQLISFNRHHIEAGVGMSFTFSIDDSYAVWGNTTKPVRSLDYEPFFTFRVGYRYQKPSSHWLFKALFTPVIEYVAHKEFTPWGGLTVGYNF